jgi:uncharacterized protein
MRPAGPTSKLAAVGTAAGFFSGLMGVGGGTVIVPLLVLWLGYEDREATGTSLAAIVFIAAIGATISGFYGNLHPLDAALVGVPALGGVLAGVALQQRVPVSAISIGFAAFLVVVAVKLLIG